MRGFMGIRSVFERAGFREIKRLANGRPVMRLTVMKPRHRVDSTQRLIG